MSPTARTGRRRYAAFTLIELLVVISIISLLISILMPSLGRAREQAKGVHCVARLKEFGNALAAYENVNAGFMPPPLWYPDDKRLDPAAPGVSPLRSRVGTGAPQVAYGWTELLFAYVYLEEVRVPQNFPVQRNVDARTWGDYFQCKSALEAGVSSGHYRVYLPIWSGGSYVLERGGIYGDTTRAEPLRSTHRDRIRPKMPLIGDANELSERGDGLGNDDCSYIDAGEADIAGSNGRNNGNRFSDRHYGGTNFLFQDLHANWDPRLRSELARDYDLNGVVDIQTVP
ncbi:MAG: prepilin-type N-terminal cleavage/methylation domain-containing protein [Planctomycetes bacterium]|nr:prepilin-type N-terminal cleavage/methylation domain-containing protein [Planctomycetota bacterium]